VIDPVTIDPLLDTVMNVLVVAFIGFLVWLYARKD
jgi:hypothetical protein